MKRASSTRLPRGAVPTPRHEIEAAPQHVHDASIVVPASFLMPLKNLFPWGNIRFGDCVTAEEFAHAAMASQVYAPNAEAITWARRNGYLNGATLTQVMRTMQAIGFPTPAGAYRDGSFAAVNWTDIPTLQGAIFTNGPVKLGVAAENFETNPTGFLGAGGGACMYGYPAGLYEDHCTNLCGFGDLADLEGLFQQQGVTLTVPRGMPTGPCFAMFTWGGVNVVDAQSMLNMTYEAWSRNPAA